MLTTALALALAPAPALTLTLALTLAPALTLTLALSSDFEPKNLNVDAKLPYPDESFDTVTCVVSVDYLTRPLEV